eukprot:scaffold43492_cov23-Tisochrysis_lutea.AAC.2
MAAPPVEASAEGASTAVCNEPGGSSANELLAVSAQSASCCAAARRATSSRSSSSSASASSVSQVSPHAKATPGSTPRG